jgi:hypothetical protein
MKGEEKRKAGSIIFGSAMILTYTSHDKASLK